MNEEWTLKQGLFCLIGSSCATLLLSVGGYLCWMHYQKSQLLDEKNWIFALTQTGSQQEALKTDHLAEILGLSIDRPLSLYAFQCKAAEKKFLASPWIKSVCVKKRPPHRIYVNYEVRRPIALLADYKNIAIDETGHIFPFAPFFSPKEIPEIYLGLPPFGFPADRFGRKGGAWTEPLQNAFFSLGLEILKFLEGAPWLEGFRVKRIDVSNALAPSLGQREIVLFTEEEVIVKTQDKTVSCVFPKIIRMASKNFEQQLLSFFLLRRNMEEGYRSQLSLSANSTRFAPRIIDLRLPHLAFVENQTSLDASLH